MTRDFLCYRCTLLISGIVTLLLLSSCAKSTPTVLSFGLVESDIELEVGNTYQLHYVITPSELQRTSKVVWDSANEDITEVDSTGVVIGISPGDTRIIARCDKFSAVVSVSVSYDMPSGEGTIAAVDMGLPSGLKWASCNIGAYTSYEYGDYFAWGELEVKSEYLEENSLTMNVDFSEDISGNEEYDVARAKWGGLWRIPTVEDYEELISYCEWEWVYISSVMGMKVTGPNGSVLFFPAAGHRYGTDLNSDGVFGAYWTSTPEFTDPFNSRYLGFFEDVEPAVNWSERFFGHPIRPVTR